MNAQPLLHEIAQALRSAKLEAILIGNAAAALQGAPVTTVDFDFFFRDTRGNLQKLKQFARQLDAVVMRPFYPVSRLYRVTNDDVGLQVDFMPVIHGAKSFESVRSRASKVKFGSAEIWVASFDDIIASKQAAGRPRDRAVLSVLRKARDAQKSKISKS